MSRKKRNIIFLDLEYNISLPSKALVQSIKQNMQCIQITFIYNYFTNLHSWRDYIFTLKSCHLKTCKKIFRGKYMTNSFQKLRKTVY